MRAKLLPGPDAHPSGRCEHTHICAEHCVGREQAVMYDGNGSPGRSGPCAGTELVTATQGPALAASLSSAVPGAPACPPSRDDSRRNIMETHRTLRWSPCTHGLVRGLIQLWDHRQITNSGPSVSPLPDVAPSCPPLTPIYCLTRVESPRGVNCASPALSFAPRNKACPGETTSPCFSEDIQVQIRGVPCPNQQGWADSRTLTSTLLISRR